MELLLDVNWLAIFVGTIVSFLVGWFWYSEKLFGKKWQEGIGIAVDDQTPMMHAMVTQLGATFLLAWVIAVTVTMNSLEFAALIAFTIAGIVKANGLFTQKSFYAIAVEVGFVLVMVVLMIGVHVVL